MPFVLFCILILTFEIVDLSTKYLWNMRFKHPMHHNYLNGLKICIASYSTLEFDCFCLLLWLGYVGRYTLSWCKPICKDEIAKSKSSRLAPKRWVFLLINLGNCCDVAKGTRRYDRMMPLRDWSSHSVLQAYWIASSFFFWLNLDWLLLEEKIACVL